jgi:hypothetical protein
LGELSRSGWERLRRLDWPGWRGSYHHPENVSLLQFQDRSFDFPNFFT